MNERLSDERLEELRKKAGHFEARKQRAAARRANLPSGQLCFGVVGLDYSGPEFTLGELLSLRAVEEPPGEVELAGAIRPAHLFSAVGRYSHGIRHEIAASVDDPEHPQGAMNLAWWFASLVRVRSGCDFLVPAVAWESWSSLAAVEGNSCRVQLLEDFPLARRFESQGSLSASDLEWVERHLLGFAKLVEVPKFRLAVEAACDHAHQSNLRMVVARLWTGIESLCGVRQELRFRMSLYLAAFLEPPGADRRSLCLRVRKLYDARSAAVHGAPVSDAELLKHVEEVRTLLRRLVVRVVEAGEVPAEEAFENLLLGS